MGLYLAKIYTSIVFGDAAPQCSVFYKVKGHILVGLWHEVCRPHFLIFFPSNFVWRCIMVKYTLLLFLVILSYQCCVFYRIKGHILVVILCALCRPHFSSNSFLAILYVFCCCFLWCCPQCSTFYRVRRTKSFTILCNDPSI